MDEEQEPKKGGATFPRAALAYLRKAGWAASRVVSTSLYEEAFASERLPFLPETKQFLRSFGGLIICYVSKSGQEDVLAFLAERTARGLRASGVKCFEELIGVAPLCPVGHYLFGTCMLFMDKQGRVFGGSDETVTLIGRTGDEAVRNILTGVEAEVLEPCETGRRTSNQAI